MRCVKLNRKINYASMCWAAGEQKAKGKQNVMSLTSPYMVLFYGIWTVFQFIVQCHNSIHVWSWIYYTQVPSSFHIVKCRSRELFFQSNHVSGYGSAKIVTRLPIYMVQVLIWTLGHMWAVSEPKLILFRRNEIHTSSCLFMIHEEIYMKLNYLLRNCCTQHHFLLFLTT